jgi:hypothetical protein
MQSQQQQKNNNKIHSNEEAYLQQASRIEQSEGLKGKQRAIGRPLTYSMRR